jgi:hypothetical protein
MKPIFHKPDRIFLILIVFAAYLFGAEIPYSKQIRIIDFNKEQLPKEIIVKGTISECVKFADAKGTHILVVTEYVNGEYMTPSYVSEIFAGDFLETDSKYHLLWKIWDSSNSVDATVGYEKGSLKIFDLDSNGIADSRFFYSIVKEGADPETLKYMMHLNTIKLAIRGEIPVEDDPKQYQKNIDKAFEQIPLNIKKIASDDWDNFINTKFDILKRK